MKDDRQIVAELLHSLHFLPHFNYKVIEPIFTIFLHDVKALLPLLVCTYIGILHSFSERHGVKVLSAKSP